MRTYKNLYSKLCSFHNLSTAFRKAKKNKRRKPYVGEFELNLENELLQLKRELETMTYEPHPLKQFVIRDPKTRVIHASNFRDRVVHHALCNIIEPIFEKTFIHDSYANRLDKGTLAASARFDEFQRKVSRNGQLAKGAKDDNMVIGYVLKADIKHYFPSVDHEILMRIIEQKIDDEHALWLIRKILENNYTGLPKGVPIGNLTSQLFANVYLNPLDYFVKHELKARFYLRYVDDFIVVDRSRTKLEDFKLRIDEFLTTDLALELHEEKSKVYSLYRGINLLGFRTFYHYKIPKKSNIRALDRRMSRLENSHEKGLVPAEKITESFDGWLAYAKHGNTFRLRRRLQEKYRGLFAEP